MRVVWHERSLPELVMICNHGSRETDPGLRGCYAMLGNVCHIYTLPLWVAEQRGELEKYHADAGHELDHCRRGDFHGQVRGVYVPAWPLRGPLR